MLYIWIISLIFYRYTFFTLDPERLTPPYWINMGAVAISTLAGTRWSPATHSALLRDLLAVREGLHADLLGHRDVVDSDAAHPGVWRHVFRRFPLTLRPRVLGGGLPARDVHRRHLPPGVRGDCRSCWCIPRYVVYVALSAWALTGFGLALQLMKVTIKVENPIPNQ